jgi:hypothetical protein
MPNGADKNFVRLCCAIDGFRIRYKAWPTAVRLRAGIIADLRDHVLGVEAFAKVEAKVRLIPDEALMIAEDVTGRAYDYEKNGPPSQEPDIRAQDWLGVEALESVRYDHATEAAVHLMTQPNYLGDPNVIARVLGELWNSVFKRWNAGVTNPATAGKEDTEECERAARIFLGMDANFTAIPAWNRPGIIDCHVAKVMHIRKKDPVDRITRMLLSFLTELWDVVATLQKKGVSGDQFQQQGADVVFQKYRLMLIGYVEPTPTNAT